MADPDSPLRAPGCRRLGHILWVQSDRFGVVDNRVLQVAQIRLCEPPVVEGSGIVWVQSDRFGEIDNRVLPLTQIR